MKTLSETLYEGLEELIKNKYDIEYVPNNNSIKIKDKSINKQSIWNIDTGKQIGIQQLDDHIFFNLMSMINKANLKNKFGIPQEINLLKRGIN